MRLLLGVVTLRNDFIEAGSPSPNVSSSIRGRFALQWIFIGSMFNASCLILRVNSEAAPSQTPHVALFMSCPPRLTQRYGLTGHLYQSPPCSVFGTKHVPR